MLRPRLMVGCKRHVEGPLLDLADFERRDARERAEPGDNAEHKLIVSALKATAVDGDGSKEDNDVAFKHGVNHILGECSGEESHELADKACSDERLLVCQGRFKDRVVEAADGSVAEHGVVPAVAGDAEEGADAVRVWQSARAGRIGAGF